MRINEFGRLVRNLRMDYDIPLKDMAKGMGMGASYLSALEYGERKLSQEHVDRAVNFLKAYATQEQITDVRKAAAKSMEAVTVTTTGSIEPDAQYYVAAFARRLQEGKAVPDEFKNWLESRA